MFADLLDRDPQPIRRLESPLLEQFWPPHSSSGQILNLISSHTVSVNVLDRGLVALGSSFRTLPVKPPVHIVQLVEEDVGFFHLTGHMS